MQSTNSEYGHTWPYVTSLSLSLSLITNHCMENWIRHNILIVNQLIDKNRQLYTYPNFIKIDIKTIKINNVLNLEPHDILLCFQNHISLMNKITLLIC